MQLLVSKEHKGNLRSSDAVFSSHWRLHQLQASCTLCSEKRLFCWTCQCCEEPRPAFDSCASLEVVQFDFTLGFSKLRAQLGKTHGVIPPRAVTMPFGSQQNSWFSCHIGNLPQGSNLSWLLWRIPVKQIPDCSPLG